MTVSVGGQERHWELLHLLPFDSTRKRMSVVLKDSEGKLLVFCKGADSAILPKLSKDKVQINAHYLRQGLVTAAASVFCEFSFSECDEQGSVEIEACQEQLRRYAQAGLRVLMCGVRELGQAEYRDWAASHAAAANALDKRDKLLLESYNRLFLTDRKSQLHCQEKKLPLFFGTFVKI